MSVFQSKPPHIAFQHTPSHHRLHLTLLYLVTIGKEPCMQSHLVEIKLLQASLMCYRSHFHNE